MSRGAAAAAAAIKLINLQDDIAANFEALSCARMIKVA